MLESDWLDLAELYGELWPRSPLPRGAIEGWYPLLADLDRRDVVGALRVLALQPERRFPPEVGEIRAAVLRPGAGRTPWPSSPQWCARSGRTARPRCWRTPRSSAW